MTRPPEWQIRCPWCQAAPGQRCTSPRGRRLAVESHDARHTAWARQTACCPECQVTPGTPCRTADGHPMPFRSIHARRYQEAEDTCA